MLDRDLGTLVAARDAHLAIGAFSTYTIESTIAICRGAERAGAPVIIQIASGAYAATSLRTLAAAALAAAAECAQPVGVHLDHSRDLHQIRTCLDLGFTSVMADGSRLSFEENVAFTKTVVEVAHRFGAWVEAELGPLAGDEHASSEVDAGALTEPADAAAFAAATGCDVLACAVGTVHGFSPRPVVLDVERVRAISELVEVPFALHGASGVDDAVLADAVDAGAAKVNVNAELRRAYLAGVARGLDGHGDDVVGLQREAIEAMADVVVGRLVLFGRGRAGGIEEADRA